MGRCSYMYVRSRFDSFYINLCITFSLLLLLIDMYIYTYRYTISNYVTRQNDAIDSMFCSFFSRKHSYVLICHSMVIFL